MPKRKTHAEFIKEISEKYGTEFTILGTYINAHTKILVRHNVCNESWDVAPMTLSKKSVCPFCAGNRKYTNDNFKEKVKDLFQEEYIILGNYINAFTDLKVKHTNCGNEFYIRPNNLLNGKSCPICSREQQSKESSLSSKEFQTRIMKTYGDDYEILDEYKNSKTYIRVYHKKCNKIAQIRPDHFMNGTGCPNCNLSSGEQIISHYFEDKNKNIPHSKQFIIKELKYQKYLRFDFAVFNDYEKEKLLFLLEFDGEHHYEPVYGEEKFELQRKLDYLKNMYCEENSIRLIRIPYWNKSCINEILNEITLEDDYIWLQ